MFMCGEYIGASVEAKATSQNGEFIKSSLLSSALSDYSVGGGDHLITLQ